MLLHDEGNAPLPLFLPRSFVLSFWTSSQETLPLSPLSQSPTAIDYPCPVPKQAGKKSAICTTAVFQPFTVLASLAPQKERDLKQKRKSSGDEGQESSLMRHFPFPCCSTVGVYVELSMTHVVFFPCFILLSFLSFQEGDAANRSSFPMVSVGQLDPPPMTSIP